MNIVRELRAAKNTDEFHQGKVDALCERAAQEIERLQSLVLRLRLEAQCHAQEARTANGTIAQTYQAVTGSTGEPGNWNGAEPVRAEIDRLRHTLKVIAENPGWIDHHCRAQAALDRHGS
jgi:hypothetical protein